MSLGLYISVPFCRTKCSYCNFASDVFSKSAYENYIARVLEDIANSRELASQLGCSLGSPPNAAVDSIYLGGGTPSILEASQLLRIFAALRNEFAVAPEAEITVECAPGTLTPAFIETLLRCGVNRVSLGVQSFVDQEAQSVGRLHKRETVIEEIGRLRQAGLDNINVDLIAGLPHQTPDSWFFSVSEAIAIAVPHVSVYMLEVDDDSRLGRELIAGGARYHAHFVPDEDKTANFYQQACETLSAYGIAQYEISNFARDGRQSHHNLKYWMRQPYLGFGVDAHSMLESGDHSDGHKAVRFSTPDSLDAYMQRAPHSVTHVSTEAAIEESFFLGLRLIRGVNVEDFSNSICHPEQAGAPSSPAFGGWGSEGPAFRQGLRELGVGHSAISSEAAAFWECAIQQCIQDGLLKQEGRLLRLTARGRLLSNEVFARFLIDETEKQKWEPAT